jgi:hypothetical protein
MVIIIEHTFRRKVKVGLLFLTCIFRLKDGKLILGDINKKNTNSDAEYKGEMLRIFGLFVHLNIERSIFLTQTFFLKFHGICSFRYEPKNCRNKI